MQNCIADTTSRKITDPGLKKVVIIVVITQPYETSRGYVAGADVISFLFDLCPIAYCKRRQASQKVSILK